MPLCLVNSASGTSAQRVLQSMRAGNSSEGSIWPLLHALSLAASPDPCWQARDPRCPGAAEAEGEAARDCCGGAINCLHSGSLASSEQQLNVGKYQRGMLCFLGTSKSCVLPHTQKWVAWSSITCTRGICSFFPQKFLLAGANVYSLPKATQIYSLFLQ